MENFIYVELVKGGSVMLNTKHIVYLKTRIDNDNTMEAYYNIYLSNGDVLETNYTFKEITHFNFQQYLNSLSNRI